jgi:tetratricopeptide (TPR) repeat protein
MKTTLRILLTGLAVPIFLGTLTAQEQNRYLAFQIFTYGPNPLSARLGEGKDPQPGFPDKATLRDYIGDIKRRIGTVGDGQTRLAVVLGPLSFDHTDAEVTRFIEMGFELALETDVAVGFHIDDSMFWTRRKDLWSDPNNVEALDWNGTPCTGRRLDWQTAPGSMPDYAPPQMCFNSKAIVREVQQRSALMGKSIQAGVKLLRERKRPELFAGVIAGWETMIGQDFETGKYLGFRALLNRGFSREHPPADMDLEREKVVQEFVELWAKGFADAGASQQKIYSHIAPFPRRAFSAGKDQESYSQHNHFATTPVAFGRYHQPGFSTYPAPGRFEELYEELDRHQQLAWASSEGTNLQLGAGPGQSGMTMETYLAKMFNHGATLVNLYSWGLGGEANKNMSFRMVTEGEEALRAYRKVLRGDRLVEGPITLTLMERLPPKIRTIQQELPTWVQNAANKNQAAEATAFMQKLQEQLKGRNFEEAESTADSILKLMGPAPESAEETRKRLTAKVERVQAIAQEWAASGRDPSSIGQTMEERFKPLIEAGKIVEAEAVLDRVLQQLSSDGRIAVLPAANAGALQQRVPEEARKQMRHRLDSSYVVFRDKVQEELKLTGEQKEALEEVLPDAMQFFQKINELTPEEQEKELRAYRPVAHLRLAAVLQERLDESQRTRLLQIERQRDQLYGGESAKELQVTAEQQKQFMPLIQETQQKIKTLMAELHKGGNVVEVRSRVLQARADLERQLEALLTDAQRKQWKEMLGKLMDVNDIFDM